MCVIKQAYHLLKRFICTNNFAKCDCRTECSALLNSVRKTIPTKADQRLIREGACAQYLAVAHDRYIDTAVACVIASKPTGVLLHAGNLANNYTALLWPLPKMWTVVSRFI